MCVVACDASSNNSSATDSVDIRSFACFAGRSSVLIESSNNESADVMCDRSSKFASRHAFADADAAGARGADAQLQASRSF